MNATKEAARGKWKEIIPALTGIGQWKLTDQHQPCPFCGGKDRYRFDDLNGDGTWFCNQACAPGGKQAGNGFSFLMNYFNEDFKSVVKRVEEYFGLGDDDIWI